MTLLEICIWKNLKWLCSFCDEWLYIKDKVCEGVLDPVTLKHSCGHHKCKYCKEVVDSTYECYIQPGKLKPPSEKYIFYDFKAHPKSVPHHINLCCWVYMHSDKIFNCYNIEDYCKYIFTPQHYGYTLIAHNAKGYDLQFIKHWLIKNNHKFTEILMGTKIMCLEAFKVRFIDSLNFLTMSLKSFSETFNLKETKGYYPILFNTPENENYVGVLPDKKYFNYNHMKLCDRDDFLGWYGKNQNVLFNNKEELLKYCQADVLLLKKGCLAYREGFVRNYNLDPFQYVTQPSTTMTLYRFYFMPKDSIGLIEPPAKLQWSKICITWLEEVAHKENIYIHHACNGGEVAIGKYHVDGYCNETNTVYEFHGGYWHGCLKCYKPHDYNSKSKSTMSSLHYKTIIKINELKRLSFTVIHIWECEYKPSKGPSGISFKFFDPREAFYGGRVEAFKLYYKGLCDYVDINSNYPSGNACLKAYEYYPVGHSIIIKSHFDYSLKSYFGVVYCRILPPKGLYIPVLPIRIDGKNVYTLCYKCAHMNNQGKCTHNDYDRSFVSAYTTPELHLSILEGYKVLEIYQVDHFKEKSKPLFRPFIEHFHREKTLATQEMNPGKRQGAKNILVTLWRKYAQRLNKTQRTILNTHGELWNILLSLKYTNFEIV